MMTGDPCVPCAGLVTTHFAPKSNKNQEKVQVQINICHITFYCQGSTHQSSVRNRKLLKNSTARQTTKNGTKWQRAVRGPCRAWIPGSFFENENDFLPKL